MIIQHKKTKVWFNQKTFEDMDKFDEDNNDMSWYKQQEEAFLKGFALKQGEAVLAKKRRIDSVIIHSTSGLNVDRSFSMNGNANQLISDMNNYDPNKDPDVIAHREIQRQKFDDNVPGFLAKYPYTPGQAFPTHHTLIRENDRLARMVRRMNDRVSDEISKIHECEKTSETILSGSNRRKLLLIP